MENQIRKDRDLLIIFFLVWVGSTLWALRYYPLIKNFDFSRLKPSQFNILFFISIINLISFIMSAIYIYKLSLWVSTSNLHRGLITFAFVATSLLFGLVSSIIVLFVLYKAKTTIQRKEK